MDPELAQRAVAELLTPGRASSASALRPVLLRLNEQLRAPSRPGTLGDTQRIVALKGLLPEALLDCFDDVEETRATFELKVMRADRQVGRGHTR
eukprot:5091625-Alexandrium_andersonii.AAC.1